MKNSFAVYTCILGFIGAVFISSFFAIGITFSFLLFFLGGCILIFRKFFAIDPREKIKILYIFLFLLSFGIGTLRYEMKDNASRDACVQRSIGSHVTISGIISDEPQEKENGVSLVVDFQNISHGTSTVPVFGKAIVNTGLYPVFYYGDLVKISGTLETPTNFYTPGSGKDFDYVSYLAKDDIFYTMKSAQVALISSDHGSWLKRELFYIKNYFIVHMNQNISEPEASLLSGILLGAKASLDTKIVTLFQIAGLSHIIVLSGYNITVVASAIMDMLSFLPKTTASSFGILGIILFVIMSGGTSTAVRAGIMSVIALIAEITHRTYDVGRALFATIAIMIFINPKILVFDISFQLSCLATIAVIYVAPILEKKFYRIPETFGLREIVSMTLAAQIFVLPLILYQMGILSLVALPANIFVLAVVPATMLFGFITGVIGCVWLPLSVPFAWISYVLLAYIIAATTFFAQLPWSHLMIPWFSGGMMALCYVLMTVWIFYERNKEKRIL